jgi:hypothetical protein
VDELVAGEDVAVSAQRLAQDNLRTADVLLAAVDGPWQRLQRAVA